MAPARSGEQVLPTRTLASPHRPEGPGLVGGACALLGRLRRSWPFRYAGAWRSQPQLKGWCIMSGERETRPPRLPPRWFVRCAWLVHRGLYRVTAGRIGLWRPKGNRWGAMRLTAAGRRTGRRHSVMIGYLPR